MTGVAGFDNPMRDVGSEETIRQIAQVDSKTVYDEEDDQDEKWHDDDQDEEKDDEDVEDLEDGLFMRKITMMRRILFVRSHQDHHEDDEDEDKD